MAHRPVWWGHLPNWSSLFLNDASLCQIDIPMTITVFLTVCAEYYLTTESCVVLKYKWTFQHDSKWNKPYTVVQYALGFHSYERCRQSKSAQKGGTVESKVWGTFRTLTANEWDIAFKGLGGFWELESGGHCHDYENTQTYWTMWTLPHLYFHPEGKQK